MYLCKYQIKMCNLAELITLKYKIIFNKGVFLSLKSCR